MKQLLCPLAVPWMVSPSVPNLRLSEVEDGLPVVVQFTAHFVLRAEQIDSQRIGFPEVEVTRCSRDFHAKAPVYGLVRLTFEKVVSARCMPAFSEREILNPEEFDVSAIPYATPSEDVGAWLSNFHSLWLKTGYCPDPRVYRVESSHWIANLKLRNVEHFVIEGHDEYLELIAERWRWDEVETGGATV